MADARSTALLDMTLLPPLEEVLDLAAAQLAAWMPNQRWYAHKGAGAPQVEVAGWAPLRIAPDHATVLLVAAVHLGDGDRPAVGGAADGSVGSGPAGAPVAPGPAPGAPPRPLARDAAARLRVGSDRVYENVTRPGRIRSGSGHTAA